MKTLPIRLHLYSILESELSGTWLLLLIDATYRGCYCVHRLFTYAMTITALQSISTWKTGCFSYSWMYSSNENYELEGFGPLDTAILSLRVKCVALATV